MTDEVNTKVDVVVKDGLRYEICGEEEVAQRLPEYKMHPRMFAQFALTKENDHNEKPSEH